MGENGLSLADIAAVTDKNDGAFGGGNTGMWVFGLLILLLIGGGGGLFGANHNTNGAPVTEAGLCNAMNFNDLQNAVGRLSDNNQQQTMTLANGLCNLGYENLSNISALGKEVALGQANLGQLMNTNTAALSQQMSNGFCETLRSIDKTNANIDAKFAALEKSQLEQTIASQQNQINQLYLQTQMCGVVRYPNQYVYSAGNSPFCGCCANVCGYTANV